MTTRRSPEPASALLGVRTSRNAPILFVLAAGVAAEPGARVIVRLEGEENEREAIVAVGTGQLLFAGGVRPAGTVVRLAL